MDIKVDTNTIVVFDLDDTLYYELDYLKSAYCEIAKELEPASWKVLYARMLSLYRSGRDTFAALQTDYGISKKVLIEKYRTHTPSLEPRKGVKALFLAIQRAKGRIVVLTDGRSDTQRAKLKSLGLADTVDAVYVSEDLGTEKPDPNNFKTIMNECKGRRYYYLADNPKKDFLGCKPLGWITIGLLDNGMHIHKGIYPFLTPDHLPDHMICGFEEIRVVQ